MQNSGFSSAQKQTALKNANKHFLRDDTSTDLAKDIIARTRAADDANTLRLRKLRLAKEEADKLAIQSP